MTMGIFSTVLTLTHVVASLHAGPQTCIQTESTKRAKYAQKGKITMNIELSNSFNKLTYSDQVANYIKECLLNGYLSPGDQIKEVVLAEKLSMSRAPIREALQILVQEGIVVSKPQIGKQVAQLTAKEIRDSYFTGGVLEAAAVTQALPKYSKEDIKNLESVLSEMYHLAKEQGPIENITKLDNAFHEILFSRINNKLIIDLCKRSCQGISKFLLHKNWLRIYTLKEVYKRHEVILNALKAGKPAKLEKVIRQHYINAGDRMAQYGVDVKKD